MIDHPLGRRAAALFRGLLALALLWVAAASAAGLELQPCHLDHISERVRCGSLEVPEDRGSPDGRMIELRVAVLPAFRRPSAPDPVFVLAGGPGQSAVKIAALFRRTLRVANRERDIVLVDQRGTGQSSPLDCELDFDALAFDASAKARAVERCLEDMAADPRHYTTINHVLDLEAVRTALGYGPVNLYGGSYGTRVAQVYLREFPAALRALVMDGVTSMDMRVGLEMGADAQLALDRVFARCAAAPACAERFPEPGAAFQRLIDQLRANPRTVEFPDPATGRPERVTIDHRHAALGVRALLYSPDTQRLLPLLIDEALNSNFAPFIGLSSASAESILEVINPSLLVAVLCAEDLAGIEPGDIPARERDSFVGSVQAEEFLGFCDAWPRGGGGGGFWRCPEAAPRPFPSPAMDWSRPDPDSAPILFLSGALDPATPPYRAEAAAAGMSNARHIEVAAGGHIVGAMGCVPDLIAEFFEQPDPAALDPTCIEDIAYPSFFVSLLGPKP